MKSKRRSGNLALLVALTAVGCLGYEKEIAEGTAMETGTETRECDGDQTCDSSSEIDSASEDVGPGDTSSGASSDSESEQVDTAANCTQESGCDESTYCRTASCASGIGACVERPLGCPSEKQPVCGCDGKTYDNECLAAWWGRNVAYAGACSVDTCTNSNGCPIISAYCHKQACEDKTGYCVDLPNACPGAIEPTCGCDGKLYESECHAARAGINVDWTQSCL